MNFVRNLDRDEFRCGFLVTSDRKKLWNIEINLLHYFQQLCEKHHLKFFMTCGTLLGAVRHQGFIPWDDDMDFAMLRPDYEKLKSVKHEFKHPYFFDLWYENGGIEECATASTAGITSRIHNVQTTALYRAMHLRKHHLPHGILIDVSPIDSYYPPPPEHQQLSDNLKETKIILDMKDAALWRDDRLKKLQEDPEFVANLTMSKDDYIDFINKPLREKGILLEKRCADFFHESEYMHSALDEWYFHSKYFRGWTYLPFENTNVPVPVDYEELLTETYGDWHEFKPEQSTQYFYSIDIPYKEFFENCRIVKM